MPRGRVHRRVGRVVGPVYAGVRALSTPTGDPLLEAIGGYFGGTAGASLPDIIEPGCWNHRRVAHSVSTGAALASCSNTVEGWAEWCRTRVRDYRAMSSDPSIPTAQQIWFNLVALFWQALAGFLNGALAGYLSHLVL